MSVNVGLVTSMWICYISFSLKKVISLRKKVSFIEQDLPKSWKPKLFICKVTDTEQNGPIQNLKEKSFTFIKTLGILVIGVEYCLSH